LPSNRQRPSPKRRAELRYVGYGAITLGQLAIVYREHKKPLMTAKRQKTVESMPLLLERQIGPDQTVEDLTQDHIDAYAHARRTAVVVSPRHRTKDKGVADGTIRNELHLLCSLTAWATTFRRHGRPVKANAGMRSNRRRHAPAGRSHNRHSQHARDGLTAR
jgi:hypothetical protein